MKRTSVVLNDDGIATWSYQNEEILLQTETATAQWNPYSINIRVSDKENCVMVEMNPIDGTNYPNYQTWYFRKGEHTKLVAFFKSIGFPCHQPK